MAVFSTDFSTVSLDMHEAWVAACARLLFATMSDNRRADVNECLTRLEDYLEQCLFLRLLETDERWQTRYRWIDGLSARPAQVRPPSNLRLRGSAYLCAFDDSNAVPPSGKFVCATYEPFDLELVLSPVTGQLAFYRFRFGDARPYHEKLVSERALVHIPSDNGWAFTFYRGCTAVQWQEQEASLQYPALVGNWPSEEGADDDFTQAGSVASLAEHVAIGARLLSHAQRANDDEAAEICIMHLRHHFGHLQSSFSRLK